MLVPFGNVQQQTQMIPLQYPVTNVDLMMYVRLELETILFVRICQNYQKDAVAQVMDVKFRWGI